MSKVYRDGDHPQHYAWRRLHSTPTDSHIGPDMSAEKRPAADAFGSTQLVKRAKSDANVNGSSAVTVVNGTAQNGALIQAVCRPPLALEKRNC